MRQLGDLKVAVAQRAWIEEASGLSAEAAGMQISE